MMRDTHSVVVAPPHTAGAASGKITVGSANGAAVDQRQRVGDVFDATDGVTVTCFDGVHEPEGTVVRKVGVVNGFELGRRRRSGEETDFGLAADKYVFLVSEFEDQTVTGHQGALSSTGVGGNVA